MFGERCQGHVNCGHTTNWTCPCTCDEEADQDSELGRGYWAPQKAIAPTTPPPLPDAVTRYLQHDNGCEANDLDYLDYSPCTCGLRVHYNPKGRNP